MQIAGCEKLRIGVERVLVALGFTLPRGEGSHVAATTPKAEHVQETAHPTGARRVVVVVVYRAEAYAGRRAERGAGNRPDRVGLAASRAGDVVHQHVITQVEPAHGGTFNA